MVSTGPDGGEPRGVDAAVSGRATVALLDGAEASPFGSREAARTALAERGIEAPGAERWYPVSDYAAALEELASDLGPAGLRCVAVATPWVTSLPTASVPAALGAIDAGYRRSHRGDAGGYSFRQIGAADGRIECDTPYPCAFDRSVVEGAADRVADGFVCLNEVGACRETGEDRCTYELTW